MTPGIRARRRLLLGVLAGATLLATAGGAAAAIPTRPAHTWGTNGRVLAILPVGDRVYVAGEFSAVVDPSGVSHDVNNLAVYDRLSGAFDLSWQGDANNSVNALAATGDGRILLAGSFTRVDGVSRSKLAAVSAATGAVGSWSPTTDGPVDAIAVTGSEVVIGGNFATVTDGGGNHARAFVAKLDATTGEVAAGWSLSPNDRVRALSILGSAVYVGGDFYSVSGVRYTNKLVKVDLGSGTIDTAFHGVANNGSSFATIFDLTNDGSRVFEAVGGSGGACTAVDAANGTRVWSKHSNGNMQSVRTAAGTVYCGGHFSGQTSFDGLPRFKLASVAAASGTTSSYAPVINSALGTWSLGVDADRLYVGGDFTKISGVDQPHFAMLIDTAAQTPPRPPVLTGDAADRVVHLSWQVPSSDGGSTITKYRVYRRTTGGYSLLANVPTGTTYDDTAVFNTVTYTYQVTALSALGEGAASNEVAATPRQVVVTVPGPPQGLLATGDAGFVHLTWNPPADDGGAPVTAYRLYRDGAQIVETSARTFDDAAVVAGTTYSYTVTAVNSQGEGGPSAAATATPTAGRPSAPQDFTATVDGAGVHLSWSPPTSDGGSPVTKYVVTRDAVRLVTVPASQRAYTDATVVSGTTYEYKVRAINAVGGGTYSAPVVVTAP